MANEIIKNEREIKFRAWDETDKKFVFEGFSIIGETALFGLLQLYPHEIDKVVNWKIQQYTGLKDKNGKEIYEGDVLKVDWKDPRYKTVIGIAEWDNKEAAYRFVAGVPSEINWSHEVVGNIYENPELIK